MIEMKLWSTDPDLLPAAITALSRVLCQKPHEVAERMLLSFTVLRSLLMTMRLSSLRIWAVEDDNLVFIYQLLKTWLW